MSKVSYANLYIWLKQKKLASNQSDHLYQQECNSQIPMNEDWGIEIKERRKGEKLNKRNNNRFE